jgi:hypothetical protein
MSSNITSTLRCRRHHLTQQDRDNYVPLPVAAKLRNLLGRRLLREARYDEAPAYFDSLDLQKKATWYGQLRHDAESKWWPSKRAFAYFHAATLARNGEWTPGLRDGSGLRHIGWQLQSRKQRTQSRSMVAEEEIVRQRASAAQPDQRYHYRYVANALASRAADYLPHTSQAFAAVLCEATGWNTGPDEKRAFYQRYVKEGPYVDWAVFSANAALIRIPER